MTEQLALPGITTLDRTSLTLGDVDFDQWVTACARLASAADPMPWWFGDLIAEGERRWGQTESGMALVARELCAVTSMDPSVLERMRHMAVLVPPERRRADLSYSHHVEVSKLDAADQVRLLDLAAEGDVDPVSGERRRWPVERLRREVRRLRDLDAGDPLPGLPPSTRPLRVMVPRETVAAALPALVDAVRLLPAGGGRAAVMDLVELLEKETTT